MKTEKKLKLDTLSSNELSSKEATQIIGGVVICSCYCICVSYEDKLFTRMDERILVLNETTP